MSFTNEFRDKLKKLGYDLSSKPHYQIPKIYEDNSYPGIVSIPDVLTFHSKCDFVAITVSKGDKHAFVNHYPGPYQGYIVPKTNCDKGIMKDVISVATKLGIEVRKPLKSV